MNKRVGMTTDPDERKSYWKKEHPTLENWEIVASKLTYDEAQEKENEYRRRGYEGSPGGPRVQGKVYSVYTFKY